MKKFKKLVAAAPVNLVGWAREELKEYADEVIFYSEQPKDDGDWQREFRMRMRCL